MPTPTIQNPTHLNRSSPHFPPLIFISLQIPHCSIADDAAPSLLLLLHLPFYLPPPPPPCVLHFGRRIRRSEAGSASQLSADQEPERSANYPDRGVRRQRVQQGGSHGVEVREVGKWSSAGRRWRQILASHSGS
ncbi:hypothetical protein Dimus_033039 [Dionaea muscipula]